MAEESRPHALDAMAVPPRAKATNYPPVFAARVLGRTKRPLGDAFGLRNFGVNLTTLEPGAQSALYHRHLVQDEFVYVLEGRLLLVADGERIELGPGMCAGFPANGAAHHLLNVFDVPATYLEIGDRLAGDCASYPEDDLVAVRAGDGWRFTHRDGSAWT